MNRRDGPEVGVGGPAATFRPARYSHSLKEHRRQTRTHPSRAEMRRSAVLTPDSNTAERPNCDSYISRNAMRT